MEGLKIRNNKYILSWGLAFFEEQDMKRLRGKSLQGWHLKKISFFGYCLQEGEPADVIYTIDYHLLKEDDREEYLDMFKMGGWNHVCSEHNMHIFKAIEGTKPVYSDADTKKEKYNRLSSSWGIANIVLLALFTFFLLLKLKAGGTLQTIGITGFSITLVLFVPCLITYIAILIRKFKPKNGGMT